MGFQLLNKLDRVLERNIEKSVSCPKFGRIASSAWLWLGTTKPHKTKALDGIYKAQTTRPEWRSISSTPSSEHEAHARDLLLRKNLDPLQRRGVQSKLEAASWHKTTSDPAPSQQELIHANPLTSVYTLLNFQKQTAWLHGLKKKMPWIQFLAKPLRLRLPQTGSHRVRNCSSTYNSPPLGWGTNQQWWGRLVTVIAQWSDLWNNTMNRRFIHQHHKVVSAHARAYDLWRSTM